eukprot:1108047-Prorocentrum_minimum.AAC.1
MRVVRYARERPCNHWGIRFSSQIFADTACPCRALHTTSCFVPSWGTSHARGERIYPQGGPVTGDQSREGRENIPTAGTSHARGERILPASANFRLLTPPSLSSLRSPLRARPPFWDGVDSRPCGVNSRPCRVSSPGVSSSGSGDFGSKVPGCSSGSSFGSNAPGSRVPGCSSGSGVGSGGFEPRVPGCTSRSSSGSTTTSPGREPGSTSTRLSLSRVGRRLNSRGGANVSGARTAARWRRRWPPVAPFWVVTSPDES